MVLGHPIAVIAERIAAPRKPDAGAERVARRRALRNRGLIEHAESHGGLDAVEPMPLRVRVSAMKAVIWDLDGTLLDTPGAIVQTAAEVLRELGHAEIDAGAIRAGIGLPLPVALGGLLCLPPDSRAVAEAVERYRVIWRTAVNPRIHALVFPGVREGVARLQALGVRQAVATGKAQSGADANVDLAGLRPYMEVVAGYDRVPNPKPAPDLALLVLREMGLAPADAVVVGDTTHDLFMARSAGVRAIGVTYGAMDESALRTAGPAFIAHCFAEVMQILGTLRVS